MFDPTDYFIENLRKDCVRQAKKFVKDNNLNIQLVSHIANILALGACEYIADSNGFKEGSK